MEFLINCFNIWGLSSITNDNKFKKVLFSFITSAFSASIVKISSKSLINFFDTKFMTLFHEVRSLGAIEDIFKTQSSIFIEKLIDLVEILFKVSFNISSSS